LLENKNPTAICGHSKFVFGLGYQMTIKEILSATYTALSKLSKNKLLSALQSLRELYVQTTKERRGKGKPMSIT
jgi:hypothetical protein